MRDRSSYMIYAPHSCWIVYTYSWWLSHKPVLCFALYLMVVNLSVVMCGSPDSVVFPVVDFQLCCILCACVMWTLSFKKGRKRRKKKKKKRKRKKNHQLERERERTLAARSHNSCFISKMPLNSWLNIRQILLKSHQPFSIYWVVNDKNWMKRELNQTTLVLVGPTNFENWIWKLSFKW